MTTTVHEKAPVNSSQRERLKDELIYRSWKDEAFRQELLANPVAVLEREYPEAFPGGKVPENINVKVVTEDKDTLCIVLPAKPDILTKSDLLTKDLGPDAYYCGATGANCSHPKQSHTKY